jgi:hypothetical protein
VKSEHRRSVFCLLSSSSTAIYSRRSEWIAKARRIGTRSTQLNDTWYVIVVKKEQAGDMGGVHIGRRVGDQTYKQGLLHHTSRTFYDHDDPLT